MPHLEHNPPHGLITQGPGGCGELEACRDARLDAALDVVRGSDGLLSLRGVVIDDALRFPQRRLRQRVLLGVTLRVTKANQAGLLGFGGDRSGDRSLQAEGTVGYQLSRRLVVGAEYRTKPDNLRFAQEDDWKTAYAAFALTRNLTATAAYADLGSVATAPGQRGAFLSLQASL